MKFEFYRLQSALLAKNKKTRFLFYFKGIAKTKTNFYISLSTDVKYILKKKINIHE